MIVKSFLCSCRTHKISFFFFFSFSWAMRTLKRSLLQQEQASMSVVYMSKMHGWPRYQKPWIEQSAHFSSGMGVGVRARVLPYCALATGASFDASEAVG